MCGHAQSIRESRRKLGLYWVLVVIDGVTGGGLLSMGSVETHSMQHANNDQPERVKMENI